VLDGAAPDGTAADDGASFVVGVGAVVSDGRTGTRVSVVASAAVAVGGTEDGAGDDVFFWFQLCFTCYNSIVLMPEGHSH
jgi:hypothetical protein